MRRRGVVKSGPENRRTAGYAEPDRQAALARYAIAGTPPEAEFDGAVARLAAICAVPCSIFGVIDGDRIFFKASFGVDRVESPRVDSFSDVVVSAGDSVVEISDLRADGRTAQNRFVDGFPFFRFLAGVTIRSPEGYALGTLTVLDTVPRTLGPDQRAGLLLAAQHVTTLLEGRRRAASARLAVLETPAADRRTGRELRGVAVPVDVVSPVSDVASILTSAIAYVRERRRSEAALTLGFVEVHRIEQIRGLLGPPAANDVLEQVRERLRDIVRESDWVLPVAESGVVVLLDGDAQAIPASLSERLTRTFAAPLRVGESESPVAVNVALVQLDRRYASAAELVRDVYLSLDEARTRHGRARIVSGNDARDRSALASDLYAAVFGPAAMHDFVVAYQPIASLHSDRRHVIGMELVLQWEHAQHGTIDAGGLFDLVPGSGIAAMLTQFAFAEACKHMRAWQLDAQATRRPWTMFVPVPEDAWYDVEFLDRVSRAADAAGVSLHDVAFALTPATIARDFDRTLEIVKELDRAGSSIVVDRFGTGDSLLGSLHRLPVRGVKIDARFVSDGSGPDVADGHALATLVSLAHRLDLEVIANGVVTETQRELLAALSCDAFAGPLLAGPLPASGAAAFLARRRAGSRSATPTGK